MSNPYTLEEMRTRTENCSAERVRATVEALAAAQAENERLRDGLGENHPCCLRSECQNERDSLRAQLDEAQAQMKRYGAGPVIQDMKALDARVKELEHERIGLLLSEEGLRTALGAAEARARDAEDAGADMVFRESNALMIRDEAVARAEAAEARAERLEKALADAIPWLEGIDPGHTIHDYDTAHEFNEAKRQLAALGAARAALSPEPTASRPAAPEEDTGVCPACGGPVWTQAMIDEVGAEAEKLHKFFDPEPSEGER